MRSSQQAQTVEWSEDANSPEQLRVTMLDVQHEIRQHQERLRMAIADDHQELEQQCREQIAGLLELELALGKLLHGSIKN